MMNYLGIGSEKSKSAQRPKEENKVNPMGHNR